jgi:actin-related protein 2
MVFLGGAVLANIVSFICGSCGRADERQMADKHNMWVTKQEWDELGPARALEKLGAR